MKFRAALTSLLGTLTLAGPVAAENAVVLSVHAPAMDWPEARRNVEAELRASGFDVREQQTVVLDPGTLLAELPRHAEADPRSVGAVTVIRVGSTGLAYVWLRDHARLFRIDTPSPDATIAAGMLALRVADMMTVPPASAADEPPPEAPQHEAEAAPTRETSSAPPPAGPSPLWLWLGLGAALVTLPAEPGVQLSTGLSARLSDLVRLEASAAASLLPGEVRVPEGGVLVEHQQLGVHLLATTRENAPWSLSAGAGGAGLCLQAQGSPDDSARGLRDSTCAGLVSARLRLLARWGDAAVWLMTEPGWTLPAVRLRSDERLGVALGRPWWTTTVGLGWRL
jgi:hypothetical protein